MILRTDATVVYLDGTPTVFPAIDYHHRALIEALVIAHASDPAFQQALAEFGLKVVIEEREVESRTRR